MYKVNLEIVPPRLSPRIKIYSTIFVFVMRSLLQPIYRSRSVQKINGYKDTHSGKPALAKMDEFSENF